MVFDTRSQEEVAAFLILNLIKINHHSNSNSDNCFHCSFNLLFNNNMLYYNNNFKTFLKK